MAKVQTDMDRGAWLDPVAATQTFGEYATTWLADRADLVKTIEPRLLATFEQVAKGRKGLGIARVVDGLCSACRVRVRPHLYNQIRAGDQILQCESCVRILYWLPEPQAPEGEAPAAPDTPAAQAES